MNGTFEFTLLDTDTGTRHRVTGPTPYELAASNWSCDCNRSQACGVDLPDTGRCLGAHRFLVVGHRGLAEDCPYQLAEFNEDYPTELKAKYQLP